MPLDKPTIKIPKNEPIIETDSKSEIRYFNQKYCSIAVKNVLVLRMMVQIQIGKFIIATTVVKKPNAPIKHLAIRISRISFWIQKALIPTFERMQKEARLTTNILTKVNSLNVANCYVLVDIASLLIASVIANINIDTLM